MTLLCSDIPCHALAQQFEELQVSKFLVSMEASDLPFTLVLNKVDLVSEAERQRRTEQVRRFGPHSTHLLQQAVPPSLCSLAGGGGTYAKLFIDFNSQFNKCGTIFTNAAGPRLGL